VSIEWQNLRTYNGSQNKAFEELCSQLAAYENTPKGSTFIRKGDPDAGLECFWKLPSNDEWGWQAKYFPSPPDNGQWGQIDKSVKKALEKHPQLTLYTVCLPIDRADPRIEDKESFMDKWNTHEKKWRKWAQEKGMSVEFKYWGSHEILERLSREEHRGRHFFWFNKELFSKKWFIDRIEETIADAGPRYTPELNVELPIAKLFDGLGRTSEFYKNIKILYRKIKSSYLKSTTRDAEEAIKEDFDSLKETITKLLLSIQTIKESEVDFIDFDSIKDLASNSIEIVWKCIENLRNIIDEKKKKSIDKDKQIKDQKSSQIVREFGYERNYLYELSKELRSLQDLARSLKAHLANNPRLLLAGEAGTGKTHLFCDIAKHRINLEIPTVLLLGQYFNDNEPWTQIINKLGLSCTKEIFLGALEAAAQSKGQKTLIMIDALNEGEGKKLWKKHLAGFLATLSRYSWLGIALSVRTSYEDTVIPEGLLPQKLSKTVHYGFADHEYEATKTFFDHFGIVRPSIPLIIPEFQNPLFLKLFCEGLVNKGLTKVPPGFNGISSIFAFFIDSINSKLAKELDFDPASSIVDEAIKTLAQEMANKKQDHLFRKEAKKIINNFLPRSSYENSLFKHMISEGLIVENRLLDENDEWRDVVRFSYERLSDHLIAKHLLDKHLNNDNPTQSFNKSQPLGSLLKDESSLWQNNGLIEAFSIQLPERIGKELVDIAPYCRKHLSVSRAFIESLFWRDHKAFTDATINYVNRQIVKYEYLHDKFLNALLTVSLNPYHPYNANYLHKHLKKYELAERDSWWSVFLHHQYNRKGAVDRIIDLAWSPEDKNHIDDESMQLCGITLAWFLTTSNRYLRDKATKALVNLFSYRIHILRKVILEFLDVDDPYVLERLFAVAYGCAMRCTDKDSIGELSKDIYHWIFKDEKPPPNILLRDYARGVIELALYHGIELDIEVERIRPPYKSKWPSFRVPSKKRLEKRVESQEGVPDEGWARSTLFNSIMGSEDFARYIIGTNFGNSDWSSERLNEPKRLSRKEIYENFVNNLTERQKRLWNVYETVRNNVDLYKRLNRKEKEEVFKYKFRVKELNVAIASSEQAFLRTIGKKKLDIFKKDVKPYLRNPYQDENLFDLSIAQRWILQKVLNLGWTCELFGKFDRNINRHAYSRTAKKAERIGKKYQWIAYYEFLARISDNFKFKGGFYYNEVEEYDGPWQLTDVRNIDPSCLLAKTKGVQWYKTQPSAWWSPCLYNAWDSEADNLAWIKNSSDLPSLENLINVENPADGSRWFVLKSFYSWETPVPIEEDRFEIPRRLLLYTIDSYIVKKKDIETLFKWAKEQDFNGDWMPRSYEIREIFLGEFFWSPPFNYECTGKGWTNKAHRTMKQIPAPVSITTAEYMQEDSSYDCSIDETIHIYLPSKWLVDKMGLRWNGVEGSFFDEENNLVAFDPSVRNGGSGSLLINQDLFLKFLNENGYDILWTIIGEKFVTNPKETIRSRLELSGAYRFHKNKIDGKINARFRNYDS
jgi:hypothetical protein